MEVKNKAIKWEAHACARELVGGLREWDVENPTWEAHKTTWDEKMPTRECVEPRRERKAGGLF